MIKSTILTNGVRVITHRVEHMHTVSIGIWVANGTRHESLEHNGIAHFIEHLLFKGTARRTARQISLEIDSMGGILNAFTGHEYVCYYAKVLAKFLPRVTDLLTDIFLASTFPAEELERERKVILQEIKMRDDLPDEYIHDRFHQSFWNGHPLGLSILGSEETVGGMSRQDIMDYKESRYRPEDIIISAAGNIGHEELVGLMERAFSTVTSNWSPQEHDFVQPCGRQVNLCQRDLEQTLICLGTRGLSQDHPDRFALFLLNTILGGGMSSRLFQEVREKKGLAYSVYSYVISHADTGSLVVHAGTEKEHCRETIAIALEEMGRLKREPVPHDELDSAREQLKGKLLMSLESSDSLMTRLAKNEIYLKRHQSVEEILAGFDKVTSEDIQRLGSELFDGECLNLEVMGKTDEMGLTVDILQL
ncbi:pitrilysin family protein [Geobacter sp. SVR]|uniref:M16 family metallopeptidase n=1 Tax=Geobacter sp. SVR TaxID=2495594 RepID=UPI00143EF765|nr:pitrilysin family protein [Geobacter sp. SVR]BCS53750.1 peptidase M16 [Geobacter sp. SVR]GCF85741.1 peptidase M16 [Geobacter sp. SVR]